jgi:hypothetical protein
MFSQDILKEMVEVRVEPMSDFIANHLCLKTFSSPLSASARSLLRGPARGRREPGKVEGQGGRKFLKENITFSREKSMK